MNKKHTMVIHFTSLGLYVCHYSADFNLLQYCANYCCTLSQVTAVLPLATMTTSIEISYYYEQVSNYRKVTFYNLRLPYSIYLDI